MTRSAPSILFLTSTTAIKSEVSTIKQIEMRRCVSCREVRHKSEFLRVVKNPAGEVALDFSGKAAGRGAYICKSEKCAADTLKRRRLDKPLKIKVPAEIYDQIRAAADNSSTF